MFIVTFGEGGRARSGGGCVETVDPCQSARGNVPARGTRGRPVVRRAPSPEQSAQMGPMIEPNYDAELHDAGARVRAAWRADEEEWTRAAWEAWEHERTLADVARDAMHRGDVVVAILTSRTFRGLVMAVGVDLVRIAAPDGVVDLRLMADSPLTFRIVAPAREGGSRGEVGVATFRARLLQLEADHTAVELGL